MPAPLFVPRILGAARLIAVATAGILLATSATASHRSACSQGTGSALSPASFGQLPHQPHQPPELGLLAAARPSPSTVWTSAPADGPFPQPSEAERVDPALDAGLRERIARYQVTPAEDMGHGWASKHSDDKPLRSAGHQVALGTQCGWND